MVSLLFTITNTGAASYIIYYRVKGSNDPWNGPNPVTAVAGPTTPVTISAPAPNDYEAYAIAVCEDGTQSVLSNTFYSTPNCATPTGTNASISGTDFLVQYSVPLSVGQVQLLINYPNGGTFSQNYQVTIPGEIRVPIPANNYGDFFFQLKSICNETSGWSSAYGNQVMVTIANPSTCLPPEIGGSQIITDDVAQTTYRFTLTSATAQARVVINNNTTGTQQILQQTVTNGAVDVSLVKGSIAYNYTVFIFNICQTGTDNIGDSESVIVNPAANLVNTTGWSVQTAADTPGIRVTVNINGAAVSATRDCRVVVRFDCTTSGSAYCNVVIPANQVLGVTPNFVAACSVIMNSGVIVSAQLI